MLSAPYRERRERERSRAHKITSRTHVPQSHRLPIGHRMVQVRQMVSGSSQPLAGSPSPSTQPTAQREIWHAPVVHVAVAWASAQRTSHPPQWVVVLVCTSQPSLATPLQLRHPDWQRNPHVCERQTGLECAPYVQALPHAPQLAVEPSEVSQPLADCASQLPHPPAQGPIAHAPAAQVAPALAKAQRVPQAPQLLGSVVRLVSQPLAALPSQSPQPARQV